MNFSRFIVIYFYVLSIKMKDFPGPSDHYWVKLIEDARELLSDKIQGLEEMYEKRYDMRWHLACFTYNRFLLYDSYNDRLILNRKREDIEWSFTEEEQEMGDWLFRLRFGLLKP